MPLADVERAARLSLERLLEINGVDWRARERMQSLVPFSTPIAFLQQALRKKYLNRPLPLRGRAAECAQLSIDLRRQQTIGYRILKELHGRQLDRAGSARVAHDYLLCLSQLLLQLSQLYRQLPEDLWSQAHLTYQWAVNRRAARDPVPGSVSVETLYKRLIVLGATDLRRFRQREQSAIFDVLGVWCQSLRISDAPLALPTAMQIQFSREGDDAPRRVGPADGAAGDRDLGVIDIEPLTEQVRGLLLGDQGETDLDPRLDGPCLRRLLRIWEGPWRRQFPRSPASGQIALTVGLSEIHRLLGEESGDTIHQRAQFKAEDGSAQWVQPGDPWARTPYVAAERDELQVEKGEVQQRGAPRWEIVDTSAGGICLRLAQGQESLLRIGDLVHTTHGELPTSLGVVRWIKSGTREGLEIGVQILATSPAPAAMSPARRGSAIAPSLYLPANRASQVPESLITPQYPFEEGMACRIQREGSESRVRLLRLLESTGAFGQFLFAEEPRTGNPSPASHEDSSTELRLWPGSNGQKQQ